MPITKNCPVCGKTFNLPPSRSNRTYCSRRCSGTAHNLATTMTCELCGKEFICPGGQVEKRRFCSHQCALTAMKGKPAAQFAQPGGLTYCPVTACAACGKIIPIAPFETGQRKYCSPQCQHIGMTHDLATTCKHCGKRFHVYPYEAATREYCSPECSHAARKRRVTKACAHCGKDLAVVPCKVASNKHHFCSSDCAKAYAHGENSAHWQGKSHPKQCEMCGKTFTAKAYAERDGKDRFCSVECVHKWQARYKTMAVCEHCGKEFMPAHSQTHRARFCSRACMYQHKAPTSIETALIDGLADRGIPFITQYRVGRFSIDIAIVSHRLAIEADGEYWHRSDKVKERDARKTAYLKKQGWKVIRFSERQIKTHLNDCLIKIVRLVYVQLPCIP